MLLCLSRLTALSLTVALLAGCATRSPARSAGASSPPPRPGSSPSTVLPSGLRVDVHVGAPVVERREDLRVLVSIGSQSGATLRLNGVSMDIAQVMVAAQGPENIALRPGIPPLPTGDEGEAGRIVFRPVESMLLDYGGTSYLAQPVGAGRYLVQFWYKDRTAGKAEGEGKRESGWIVLDAKH
jgi:hypothetical protein